MFPQSRIPELVNMYKEKRVGYVDMLTEDFANEHHEIRWAITPSIMQHVGRLSSNEAANQPNQKGSIGDLWNFGFELNDAKALRWEHDMYLRSDE